MDDGIVMATGDAELAALQPLADRAAGYAAAAQAEATRKVYARDWLRFRGWCAELPLGAQPLPAAPALVALYITHLADGGSKPSTIARALVAIGQAHRLAGHESPCSEAPVPSTMKGIRARLGSAPTQKAAAVVPTLRAMLATLGAGLGGMRDRALLTLGFAGAFRRSELVALDVVDLAWTADGLEVTIRRSKTDQEGWGRKVGVPYGGTPASCPVRSVRAWLDAAAITAGPVFRPVAKGGRSGDERLSDRAVALVVKRAASAAGFDPATFAGHSLRAGLATSAAKAGKSERSIMAQTGHRSSAMVRRYIRDATLFDDNAAAGIGL